MVKHVFIQDAKITIGINYKERLVNFLHLS